MMGWRSSLEIYDLASASTQVVMRSPLLIEAPNWHPDGWFLVNAEGQLWRVDTGGAQLHPVEIGGLDRCNNDHGFLPDGRLVFSCHNGQGAGIYVMQPDGPHEVLPARPSWWHSAHFGDGGRRIAYACARDDRVVRIAVLDLDSGTESILTPATAHHDGPDFSACGRWIWFNSDLTGHAQIWRVGVDGNNAAPVFRNENVNWFPHPSPCGRQVLYLAYPPGTEGHPRDLDVSLWLMSPDGGNRRRILDLFGGQGTLNVPCWAPDGHAFAFIRYAPKG